MGGCEYMINESAFERNEINVGFSDNGLSDVGKSPTNNIDSNKTETNKNERESIGEATHASSPKSK